MYLKKLMKLRNTLSDRQNAWWTMDEIHDIVQETVKKDHHQEKKM